jgi:hypothetical protein
MRGSFIFSIRSHTKDKKCNKPNLLYFFTYRIKLDDGHFVSKEVAFVNNTSFHIKLELSLAVFLLVN